jgi:hypothetical protein
VITLKNFRAPGPWVTACCAIAVASPAFPAAPGGLDTLAPPWVIAAYDGHAAALESNWASVEVGGDIIEINGASPALAEILRRFGNHRIILAEVASGDVARALLAQLETQRIGRDRVIVSSSLSAELAQVQAKGYRTCVILSDPAPPAASLRAGGHWGVACAASVSESTLRALKAAGLKVLVRGIDRHHEKARLLAWGADGFITRDPLYLEAKRHRRNTDPYKTQQWAPGMLPGADGDRGFFVPPDKWAIDASAANTYKGSLQGWMSPIGGQAYAPEWTMEFSVTFGPRLQADRWASVTVFDTDAALDADNLSPGTPSGFHFLFHNTGSISILRYGRRGPELMKKVTGPEIPAGGTVRYRIVVTPGKITAGRADDRAVATIDDSTFRCAYVTFGAKGQYAEFSNVGVRTP